MLLIIILVTSLLILLRTVFRLAETASGTLSDRLRPFTNTPGLFSYASTHEYLFGILEYTPVIIAIAIWAIFPLAKFFHRDL